VAGTLTTGGYEPLSETGDGEAVKGGEHGPAAHGAGTTRGTRNLRGGCGFW